MRCRVVKGRLDPEPLSIVEAERRIEQLARETDKITAQLADTTRVVKYAGRMSAYDEWARSARAAHKNFTVEVRLTREWLAAHEGDRLLRRAHELLVMLERETDFDEEEATLVRQIGTFLAAEKQPHKERA